MKWIRSIINIRLFFTREQSYPSRRNHPLARLMTESIEDLQKGIEKQHPYCFYVLAMKLFKAGRKEDAVFWFYAGQLRYRVYFPGGGGGTGGLLYNLSTGIWTPFPVATTNGANFPGAIGSSPYGPSFGSQYGILNAVGNYDTRLATAMPLWERGRIIDDRYLNLYPA